MQKRCDSKKCLQWLLSGDVSVQYQTRKYLLSESETSLYPYRRRIASEGWGRDFLAARQETGHWGRGFYQNKWTSSHYSLLDLRSLEIEPVEPIRATLARIVAENITADGGVCESKSAVCGDLCVNGMFLNYASFFGVPQEDLGSILDVLLRRRMPDGGFNCEDERKGARHSSMHTTISVLEGLAAYEKAGYAYRREDLAAVMREAEEFLLQHRLFRSDTTGAIINPRWLMLSFPSRWRYDVLRALLYFANVGAAKDARMTEAIEWLLSKKRRDDTWPVQAKHPGLVHFDMEKAGAASRLNTLRALRVLKWYDGLESVAEND